MFLEEALRRMLTEDSGSPLMQLVEGRIYCPVLPTHLENYPALAYRLVKTEEQHILEPPGTCNLRRQQFRFFSTAKDLGQYSSARRVAQALEDQLVGFKGTVSNEDSPPETLRILGIIQTNRFSLYDDLTMTHQILSEFAIWSR